MRGIGRLLPAAAACFLLSPFLYAQRPYDAYLATARRGGTEARVRAFVDGCAGGPHRRAETFYARGGWFRTDDLAAQLRSAATEAEATAEVWRVGGQPRAVYQWTHDGEFDRDVLACLDVHGNVTHAVSRYMPGESEPDQRWIYLHTLDRNRMTGQLMSHGRFTDWQGRPRGKPHFTSEDQDFIAGERVYRKWVDFDFARVADH